MEEQGALGQQCMGGRCLHVLCSDLGGVGLDMMRRGGTGGLCDHLLLLLHSHILHLAHIRDVDAMANLVRGW